MGDTSIRHLVDRVVSGDHLAFREIVEQHERLVNLIVSRMIGRGEDREDICQEIFVKVYQKLAAFRFESKLSTWIGRIACNHCLNFLEKKRPVPLSDLGDEDAIAGDIADTARLPDEIAESEDIMERLQAEIERLPAHYRTAVSLYHLEQMTYEEIGDVMKLPAGTVKSHLFRGRKLLRHRLLLKYDLEELCA